MRLVQRTGSPQVQPLMRLLRLAAVIALACSFAAASHAQAGRSVALIVQSKGVPELEDQVERFQEMLAAELTDAGFQVVDPMVVAQTLGTRNPGANPRADEAAQSAALDAMLEDNATALRYAQNMGASYIAHASLLSLSRRTSNVAAYGLNTTVATDTLRIAVKVLEGTGGTSVIGRTVEVSDKEQANAYIESNDSGRVERLLSKAARQVSEELAKVAGRKGGLAAIAPAAESATLTIAATVRGLAAPIVSKEADDRFVLLQNSFPVEATGVLVQLDGVVLGSAPDSFRVAPGLHSLTMTRDDLKPVTRTIKVSANGMRLNVSMEMTDEALARWKEMGAFLSDLKTGEQLSDAEAERIRGIAQMYRQSGFRLDLQHGPDNTAPLNVDLSNRTEVVHLMSGMNSLGFNGLVSGIENNVNVEVVAPSGGTASED